MKSPSSVLFLLFLLVAVIVGCNKLAPPGTEEFDILDGPIDGLSQDELNKFLKGDDAFGKVFTSSTGLGPVFVANQCTACHPGDGKGTPFVQLTRFGQPDTLGNNFLNFGGPQLQHKALPGYSPEVLPIGAPSTIFIAPAVTGLGFLDAVEDAYLLALSDPNDSDGDGISGRPHYRTVPNYVSLRANSIPENGRYICRFGKKSSAYDLLHQTSGAYNQDMGITSLFEPIDPYTGLEVDNEISTEEVNNVVFYLKTLKTPIQRDVETPDVIAGKNLFNQIDCAKCHTPSMETGFSSIEVLSYRTFSPYTDLLLHDMGAELDDGYTEGYALSSEWRTPPLWGLGLSKDAQGGR